MNDAKGFCCRIFFETGASLKDQLLEIWTFFEYVYDVHVVAVFGIGQVNRFDRQCSETFVIPGGKRHSTIPEVDLLE